jgi:hypothetical protein
VGSVNVPNCKSCLVIEPERSMSGDARDFNNIETRAVIKFFFFLKKLEQRAKNCIELRGEYVEQIPSLVAVACFLPGRAKDLSTRPS